MTIALPFKVKTDLDRYAEFYGAVYGEPVDAAALVPHMLAAFMNRDRVFRRTREASAVPSGQKGRSLPARTSEATSKANDTPSEASSSR